MLGWGVPTFDSLYALQSLMRTIGQGGDGNFNLGKYSNPKVDAAIDAMKTEMDLDKRRALAREALTIHKNEVGHLPLHHQVIPWAMRSSVTAVHRADNRMHAKWVKIN
jgi:peptide/nickel transport system substrate-binding protein